MTGWRCVDDPDVETFATTALPWLLGDPVRNNGPVSGVIGRLDGLVKDDATRVQRWIRVTHNGELRGVAVPGAQRGMFIATPDVDAARALADHLAETGPDLTAVDGADPDVRAFLDRFTCRTGASTTRVLRTRLFSLYQLQGPGGVPGAPREATAGDRALLMEWLAAFDAEALPSAMPAPSVGPRDHRHLFDWRLRHGGLMWLWQHDGEPVSFCWLNPAGHDTTRISSVYTPPALRGRGYAAANVAATGRRLREQGIRHCVLFTDQANPVSNRIYERIGFRPVHDGGIWSLSR